MGSLSGGKTVPFLAGKDPSDSSDSETPVPVEPELAGLRICWVGNLEQIPAGSGIHESVTEQEGLPRRFFPRLDPTTLARGFFRRIDHRWTLS